MQKDVRNTALYREAEALITSLRQPQTGLISDATDLHASPLGRHCVFAGTIVDTLDGLPPTRICLTDLTSGDTRVLTFGPRTDRSPKFSPDGQCIAFLSDRRAVGDFQLYLLDLPSGMARVTPSVEGWVEYLHWSPDGQRILLGVAGHGADVAGGQGAVTSRQGGGGDLPSWMPAVELGNEAYSWRSAWVYEIASDQVRRVSPATLNIWEAAWCGNEACAAVASSGPSEGLWYTARLHIIEIDAVRSWELYAPQDQLGWPATSPSGKYIAVVEAICSDRWIVAGELRLIDATSGAVHRLDTRGVDITYTEWRSERQLLLAGHREFETVVGVFDVVSGTFTETWRSHDITTGGIYVTVSGLNESGDCVLVGQGFRRAPEVAVIRDGQYHLVKSLDCAYAEQAKVIESVDCVTWNAPDGLEIQGWLLRPHGVRPHPLVMQVHGGPVWQWRPMWLGSRWSILMLLKRGYAVFFPNPRGSSGRGQAFARRVLGDVGGADTYDYLSGLNHLVSEGIADPARIGVTGSSYGGYMTSWLITQDPRFAAAVSVAPMTNNVSLHLISNIPHYVAMFLADSYNNPCGKYFERSPIMHAHKARTPTLNICGAHDRCTPPEEAIQFHNALRLSGVKSALVIYPEEGHGVRKLPAAIDYNTRVVGWFVEQMPHSAAV